MKTQEIPIKTGTIRILMKPDAEVLEEVVVTGMQKMDKRLFTGATQQLTADNVKLDGLPDISRGLEGRAAGVSVQNVSGTFGTAPKIRVRGATSIYGSSKPLWVVDGVIMEDAIDAVNAGALTLEKLEAMTCVCSVGLDMIAIPGDTKASTIAGIIADESAIGMVNQKTTAVRLIPVIGKGVGEVVEFGGLLGYAPIMPVNQFSCDAFVQRGGRIPAPIHSFKN